MHLKRNISKGEYYYRIVQSYRDGDQVRQKLILNLGKLTEEEAERIRRWCRAFPKTKNDYIICHRDDIIPLFALDYGDVLLVKKLWDIFGLTEIINSKDTRCRSKIDCGRIGEILTINRCLDPRSKNDLRNWYEKTTLPEEMDILPDELYANRIYRAMDHIYNVRDNIEKNIFDRLKELFSISDDVLFYDITSSYFEGNGCESAQFGYSRDKRPDKKQINWGLVLTKEGFPVTHEVYPGNVLDKTTVDHICNKLKNKFGIARCIFIGDRGLMTEANLDILVSNKYEYIIAQVMRNVREKVVRSLERISINEFEKINEKLSATEIVTEKNGKKIRYIICFNKDKVKDDIEYLERKISKGYEVMEYVRKMVKSGRIKDHDKVIARIVKHLVKYDLDHLFEWRVPSSPVTDFEYWLKEDKVEQERKLAGLWTLETNVTDLSVKDIVCAYKQLSIIERAFKIIKSWNLVRPINHRKDKRVEIHIFICVLAYLLERTIEYILEKRNQREQAYKIFQNFHNIKSIKIDVGGIDIQKPTIISPKQKNILDYLDSI